MRWHLLDTFDKIYVLDLHSNANKKEVCPDGTPDKNVFDIMQCVSIVIGIKLDRAVGKVKPLAKVFHAELWGARAAKYEALWEGQVSKLPWTKVDVIGPKFAFVPTDQSLSGAYEAYPSVADIFKPNGAPAPGLVTTHDQFAISWNRDEALLKSENEADARLLFRLCSQAQWNYGKAKVALSDGGWKSEVVPVVYRPFDTRITVYNPHVAVHRRERMTKHFILGQNVGLITSRMAKGEDFAHALAVGTFTEAILLSGKTSNNGFTFPLYLYPEEGTLETERRVNFDPKIYAEIRARAGLIPPRHGEGDHEVVEGQVQGIAASKGQENSPVPLHHPADGSPPRSGEDLPDELKVFDYIYGVLHSPVYRRTYAQFLKIDFPRIPYPASPEVFAHVAEKGGQLRRLHLMEPQAIGATPYPFRAG